MQRRCSGLTLIEILVVVSVLALMTIVIASFAMQSMRLFAEYQPLLIGKSKRLAPQAAMMLGLKRMNTEIREAMFIRVGSSDTAVEIALPKRDDKGNILLNYVELNKETHSRALMRTEGMHVCFFLGRKDPADPKGAIPDLVNGDTIFRVASGSADQTGGDIIQSDGTLPDSVSNVRAIITDITKVSYIFSYYDAAESSSYQNGMNAKIVRINLSYPVTITTPAGNVKRNQVLSTEFCLRNFETL
jgi:prepilin-type N-terminal cleavage/methylation domain-containing protein